MCPIVVVAAKIWRIASGRKMYLTFKIHLSKVPQQLRTFVGFHRFAESRFTVAEVPVHVSGDT